MLAEGRHPSKSDLDQVSAEVPIVVLHFSSHMLVANSKALDLLEIDEKSVDPEGGVIRRMPDGKEPKPDSQPEFATIHYRSVPQLIATSSACRFFYVSEESHRSVF